MPPPPFHFSKNLLDFFFFLLVIILIILFFLTKMHIKNCFDRTKPENAYIKNLKKYINLFQVIVNNAILMAKLLQYKT